ncbi:MAG: 3-hydroxyacyl-CoA dehydrogenase family protein, partial [Betaproteobacteria bacterium]|nr:3-hydroxyacyl-CoA dehydrogenase family protein [Betaproteobacteria bacterium]
IAERAIAGLRKLSPAPLGLAELADAIQPADYDHDLALLGECDLIIEAIAERLDWKHDLYRRIAPMVAPHAVLASNTSGLSIGSLAEALPDDLKARFCGVHFFNPPRYMHLAELIPIAQTRADVLDRLEGFLTTTLGKGVVRTKDTPNFIANRIGVFGMVAVMIEAERHGLTMDVVDDLTGARLGRAKSGTYRTADVVGLDTLSHVIRTMDDQLPDDPFHALYAQPALLQALLAAGALGQKTDAGFYRREGKAILRIDPEKALVVAATASERGIPIDRAEWATAYVPAGAKADETVARILKKKAWSERFGWGEGPFELWQLAGWTQVAQWIAEDIAAGEALVSAPLPAWVFEGPVAQRGGVHQSEGSWSPMVAGADGHLGAFVAAPQLPVMERQLFPAGLV